MCRFILITGRMGSGKSKVSELLRKKHYKVIDSDAEVKKLYEKPIVFQEIVNGLGPWVLNDEGHIDTSKLLSEVFTRTDEEAGKRWYNIVMQAVMWEFLDIQNRLYTNNKEVIFIEAALTPELGWCRSYLDICDVIMVKTDEKTRLDRLYSRPNHELLLKLDKTQDEKYLNLYKSDLMPASPIDPPDIMAVIENNGTVEELNSRLMVILEQELNITHEEKLAVYLRYLKEAPNYCHDNAWCYSFFNLGGCNSCPFPCVNQDKYYRKLNEDFLRSKRQ